MIHFLVKREDKRAQENQELKDVVKNLRDTHKQDVNPPVEPDEVYRQTDQSGGRYYHSEPNDQREDAELAQTLPSRD